MQEANPLGSVQNVEVPKKKSALPLLLLALLIFLAAFVTIFNLTGTASFLKREMGIRKCKGEEKCLTGFLLTKPSQVPENKEENGVLMTQNVVYMGFWGGEFWTLSLDGPIKKFKPKPDTNFGVAASVEQNDLAKRGLASRMNRGLLQQIDTQTFNDIKKVLIVERNTGHLTAEEFRDIVKSGDVLTVLYEPITNTLTGLIILDFDL
jgi:hypothetical protein